VNGSSTAASHVQLSEGGRSSSAHTCCVVYVPSNYKPGRRILRSAQLLRSATVKYSRKGFALTIFSFGSTRCIGGRHHEGGVGVLHG
jgi:hypothetical protein